MLKTKIWVMAAQVLLDIDDCPVEITKAVHALMGVAAPERPVGSPVSQINQRQARTAQALQDISTAAEAAQSSLSAAQQLPTYDAQAEAQRMQQEATQLMSAAMSTLSIHGQASTLRVGGCDYQLASAIMAPIIQQLAQANRTQRRADAWMAKAERQMEKTESFQALLSVAMVTQSQQLQGLARYQAANVRSSLASSASDGCKPVFQQPLTSPERRQVNKQNKADKRAFQQTQDMQQRVNTLPAAPHSVHQDADVLLGDICDGVMSAYPGHSGEPFWTAWSGK